MTPLTEWSVVGILITLAGLITIFVRLTSHLSTILARLDTTVAQLSRTVETLDTSNTRTHQRLFDKLEAQEDTLASHDTRITVLEKHH